MVRWLLLGLVLAGLGISFKNGWVQVNAARLLEDVGLDFLKRDELKNLYKHPFFRPSSKN
ncbi:MAG: 4-hydroxythreonine-4-phosphate dehydrogenase [Synechococcus sp.]